MSLNIVQRMVYNTPYTRLHMYMYIVHCTIYINHIHTIVYSIETELIYILFMIYTFPLLICRNLTNHKYLLFSFNFNEPTKKNCFCGD